MIKGKKSRNAEMPTEKKLEHGNQQISRKNKHDENAATETAKGDGDRSGHSQPILNISDDVVADH